MASNPPFMVEDQTDEDFFDKLVNDDDDAIDFKVTASVSVDGNESDEAKAFANLSISDDVNANARLENLGGVKKEGTWDDKTVDSDVKPPLVIKGGDGEKSSGSLVSLTSGGLDSLLESSNGDLETEVTTDFSESHTSGSVNPDVKEEEENHASGSANPGIKEVDWSVFHSNPATDGDTEVFGSYSDFFSELGNNNTGVVIGNTGENQNVGSNVVSADQINESANFDNSSSYMQQNQDGFGYNATPEQVAGGEDQNNSQYWENLYPGWKFDVNTGQWYLVSSCDSTANVQDNSAADWTVSNGKSEVSYLQQASQSVAGTVAESGTTESVNNWNQVHQVSDATENAANWNHQVSQASDVNGVVTGWNQVSQSRDGGGLTTEWNQASEVNNGYPSHMVFDPQYPGWYYDTIAMEWCSLDTYTSSTQSTIQGESQLNQNDWVSSEDFSPNHDQSIYGAYGQNENSRSIGFGSGGHDYNGSFGKYNQQNSNVWQTENVAKSEPVSEYRGNQPLENHYSQEISASSHVSPQMSNQYEGTISYHGKSNQTQGNFSATAGSQGFNQQFSQPTMQQNEQKHLSSDYYGSQNTVNYSPQAFQNTQQYPYAPTAGRSSAGRPPHALVTFGFGGKLIVMKDNSSYDSSSFGSQNPVGGSISVLNLMDVMSERIDSSSLATGACDYIQTLCRNTFPGPLVGGNAGIKELNKWIDEKIANPLFPDVDYRKGEVLRLLLSLLKIACQYYGKLRSPFGTDTLLKEDAPETAVAKLFASLKRNGTQFSQYGTVAQCLQQLPSEGQLRTTAAEVHSLLDSGRKKEALQCAQEGQLWGPALVLAAQLGDQFYVETVKQMALLQLTAGSPLRTLCLLIAGQPAVVFNAESTAPSGMPIAANVAQQPAQFGANVMLDDWEENLAVITANRTKDDELVLVHLGDCLWKERSDIVAAHICYLVAEANIEPYSDSARLCLVGADHWKFPRTYASPEAIQRTEIYEYSKVLGNSQFILPPFQPYKLLYAHMLAEVGRTPDALKYCQALSKSLKTGRAPEIETLRQLVSSLEERIKTHQEGGFATNLAPAKLVGKLLNLFDSTAHRVVGGLPPPVPSTTSGSPQGNEHHYQSAGPRVSNSQSTMAMSSLMPSASMEKISEWAADNNRMTMHNRSVSEPDFGRTPRQDHVDSSKEASSSNKPGNSSAAAGRSRFGRFSFGSQLLQKTVGLVLKPRQGRQAKLGETNKFYYDEKLKRWVEEGAAPPAEEPALAPPPTTAVFQSGAPDYNLNSVLKSEGSISNGSPDMKSPPSADNGSGIPPLPPATNQFSARSRMGVRSRYVDTFNKGGGNPTNLFQSPSVPSMKPATGNAKFFVPTPMSPVEQTVDSHSNEQQTSGNSENHSISAVNGSFQSPAPPSTMLMQRFPSMDSISKKGVTTGPSPLSSQSRRTASWSGGISDAFTPNKSEVKPLGEVLGMPPSSFMPSDANLMHSSMNGGRFGEDLHEVEL
uniref:Protein transport protein sec16 n=1 Tax=Nicotiana tabacum TaxID=4097 RepID=A0A1S3XHT6_TOBAC|nr:PREDICTED: protein transport protein SEC16A homolog [Nicotiana tabacum]